MSRPSGSCETSGCKKLNFLSKSRVLIPLKSWHFDSKLSSFIGQLLVLKIFRAV